ncbi:MAG TPA: FAD-dependent oxidoreductase, partial [Flavobacterium sp.]|nr:FAD-dependent oxidoreductase [Flavobacterium sp.]
MFTKSIWNSFCDHTFFKPLSGSLTTDVAIIGGGITGISMARKLSEAGLNVAVLEALKVGGGTTAHSTGNLYFTIDKGLATLKSKYDEKTIEAVAASRAEAINQLERWVNELSLDCDFKRVPWYMFTTAEENNQKVKDELDTFAAAGMAAGKAETDEIPYQFLGSVKVPAQGQINPMLYVQGMSKAINSENCRIYEDTRVTGIEEKDGSYKLSTTGGQVTAKYVIHATHTPKGVKFVQTMLGPYREYGIGCKLKNPVKKDGIFWGYHEGGKKTSTRSYSRNGESFLLIIGEPHKVGQVNSNIRSIEELEKFAKR